MSKENCDDDGNSKFIKAQCKSYENDREIRAKIAKPSLHVNRSQQWPSVFPVVCNCGFLDAYLTTMSLDIDKVTFLTLIISGDYYVI